MPHPRLVTFTAIAGYNLVQNRVVPASWYVPANIAMSAWLVLFARRQGCSPGELGFDARKARAGMRLGALAAFAVAAVVEVASSRPGMRRRLRDERSADQEAGEILYRIFVRFPLGTALFEEVAFRGVVEAIWSHEGASEKEAANAAAVLFGLWHLVPTRDVLEGNPLAADLRTGAARAGAVVAGATVAGVSSLGFSWLRRKSGSLVAPWLAHTAISIAGYLAGISAWRHQTDG
jgi:membrane protease YdiL (CAAX protease family)